MIEKIEIAVLDRLNQAFGNTKPALGYKIEKIDSYKAELSDFGTLIKNRRTAALVACGGALRRPITGSGLSRRQ